MFNAAMVQAVFAEDAEQGKKEFIAQSLTLNPSFSEFLPLGIYDEYRGYIEAARGGDNSKAHLVIDLAKALDIKMDESFLAAPLQHAEPPAPAEPAAGAPVPPSLPGDEKASPDAGAANDAAPPSASGGKFTKRAGVNGRRLKPASENGDVPAAQPFEHCTYLYADDDCALKLDERLLRELYLATEGPEAGRGVAAARFALGLNESKKPGGINHEVADGKAKGMMVYTDIEMALKEGGAEAVKKAFIDAGIVSEGKYVPDHKDAFKERKFVKRR